MKKILPILFAFIFAIAFFVFPRIADAQVTPTPVVQLKDGAVPPGSWVIDPEVTFIGKNAARSGNLLDFILQNYNWVCVRQAPGTTQCDNSGNPLKAVWNTTVIFIIAPLLLIVILAASVIIIATRGRSLTITRFFPRFMAVLLLIAISFSLLQFFYQFVDSVQGFFLRREIILIGTPFGGNPCPPDCISQKDLLYVGWDYRNFIGLRLLGDQNSESAFISLLLTKLTALTYYVMVGILIIRKIILWLFIIVSPIFPILLLFYPIRNTGKIWIGEFFRWLLYAPLFAIFLNGLVALWRNQIPLVFSNPDIGNASKIIYPTAVNILLGGPKQFVTPTNSVNLTETFGLYVVSLLMLWGVIILPWILLQIFLDYAQNLGVGDSAVMKNLVNKINTLQSPPGSPAHPPAPGGATINLPFAKKFNLPIPPSTPTGLAREIPISTTNVNQASYMPSAQVKAQTLSMVNMSLPSMRDIAKYDTSLISNDKDRQKETTIIRENLEKIGNPASVSSTTEKERFTEIREKLLKESSSGNTLATSIINAASIATKRSSRESTAQIKSVLSQIANPASVSTSTSTSTSTFGASSVINREKIAQMNESLVKAKKEGNTLAASILSVNTKTSDMEIEKLQERIMDAKVKGEPIAAQLAQITQQKAAIPTANRVQTVSHEDYEAVKDMWKENYKNLEVPEGMVGTRSEWIKADMTKIEEIIQLLSAQDVDQVNKGMEEVSGILPFLLVGGFSQAEILTYLKAKLEAAKDVAAEIVQDEEDKVPVSSKKTTQATQTMTASISNDSGEDESDLSSLSSSASSSTVQPVSNELLSLTNLQLPKLTDIVKYEVRHLTKDKKESERVEKIREVLEKIGNPASMPTESEREQYKSLQEKLTSESKQGNITADVILSAVSQLNRTASQIDATLTDVKQVLLQIVNSNNISDADDRDYYTRLHEYLAKESSEKKNVLAGKILSVSQATKSEEVEEIRNQLAKGAEEGKPVLPQLTKAINDYSSASQMRSVINQIVTPEQIPTAVDRVNFVKLHDSLTKESQKGNSLAAELLSVNEKTPDTAIIKLQDKLVEAGKKGDGVASAVLSQKAPGAFVVANRLQEVTPQEYEEVRNLWQKAYKQYFVPQGFTEDEKGRMEWINKDAADIEETVNMLNSPDPEMKNKGLEKVSSILPFLLLGGYSFGEINNYLKIKLEAAKSAFSDMQQEEDTQVAVVAKKNIVTPQSMSTAVVDEHVDIKSGLNELSASVKEDKVLNVSKELSLENLKTPTLQDLARYEALAISKKTEFENMTMRMKKVLEKSHDLNGAKKVLIRIANPVLENDVLKRAKYSTTHDLLLKASLEGDQLAHTVLSVTEKTTDIEVGKILEQVEDGRIKNDPVALGISALVNIAPPVGLPSVNQVQKVGKEDYENVVQIWKENYRSMDIPQGLATSRLEWVRNDSARIEAITNQLNSADKEQVEKGMQEVSSILPVVLIGGFTKDEIVGYLNAKKEAAKETEVELSSEEDQKVEVTTKAEQVPKEMSVSENKDDVDTSASSAQEEKK